MNRSILRLAIPALGTLAIDPLLTLTDTAFVARIGVTELAALGVDTAILGFAFFGFNFLAYVTTPLVARALGRGDRDGARRWVGDALVLAALIGLVVSGLLIVLAPLFVDLMGAGPAVEGPAVSYLRIRALATPAVLLTLAGHGAFRGHQDTRSPLLVAIAVNLVNVVLDPVLIFAVGWGLEGAAVATVVAQWLGASVFGRLLSRRGMVTRPRDLRAEVPSLLSMGWNGLLVSARTGALLVSLTVAASIATRLGPERIAAHQVVMQVWLLASMFADAFGIAGQAMVGEAVGRADRGAVTGLARRLMLWGFGVGIFLLLAFRAGRGLVPLVASSPEVGVLVVASGAVAGLMQPIAGPLFVADGIFLGLLGFGTLVVSTVSGSVVGVSLMLLTSLGDSLVGIWWALSAMVAARLLVLAAAYPRSVTRALRS